MSINNVDGIVDAMKYINGSEITQKESSIVSDVAGSVVSPFTCIFGVSAAKSGLQTALDTQTFKEGLSLFANKGKKLKDFIGTDYTRESINALKDGTINYNTEYTTLLNEKALKNGYNITDDGITLFKKSGNAGKTYKGTAAEIVQENGTKAVQVTRTGKGATRVTGSIKDFWNDAVNAEVMKADAKTAAKIADKADDVAAAAGEAAGTTAKASKGIFSKIGGAIKNVASKIPGASKVGKLFSKIGGTKFGKCLKGTGAIGMMMFEGVIEFATEVVPAFTSGGLKSGLKQMGKSAVKVVSSGLGWAGGQLAGKAIGAKLGAMIGTLICPGAGSVAGAAIGGAVGSFIGGSAGSALASGVAKKVVGKSESEINKEKQLEEQAQQIAADPNMVNELNAAVYQMVQQEIQNGTADADTEKMAEYLNQNGFDPNLAYGGDASYNPDQTYNPYETYDTNQTTNPVQTPTQQQSYWTVMAQRAAQGDTSIYNVSGEKLNSLFTYQNNNQINLGTNGFNSNNTAFTGAQSQTNGQYNYFAMG